MPSEILLLTGPLEAHHLATALNHFNAGAPVIHVETGADLDAALRPGTGQRLIAFCTGVVVPERVLKALGGPAYNFHPGPPTYPGSWASGWALYEGATQFGATLHVMEKRVDEGPIVAVDWFDVPDDPKLRYDQLEILAYQAALRLFRRFGPQLARSDAPLHVSAARWTGAKRTKYDALLMKEPPQDASEEEIRRRFRAFG